MSTDQPDDHTPDVASVDIGGVDYETAASGDKPNLRLWLRLLTCANMIETEVRSRLRSDFDVTLPRFDLMAQLEKAPDGLTMSELSRRLMVSNGNITGIVDRLVAESLITRTPNPHDRRTQFVRLTARGRRVFLDMAAIHQGWIDDLFSGLTPDEGRDLFALLGRAKASIRTATENGEA
ncbi:MarR family transcriptional regulator [Fodinicurvata sp. EGI_FJ10296]|uniref:MarR family winged helix-turn-helix transcriptional regulator n=1 Tax=Fodinicurvata sp. EGI_FJ10296 TaxID=3231908 RepID=UPI003454031B